MPILAPVAAAQKESQSLFFNKIFVPAPKSHPFEDSSQLKKQNGLQINEDFG